MNGGRSEDYSMGSLPGDAVRNAGENLKLLDLGNKYGIKK